MGRGCLRIGMMKFYGRSVEARMAECFPNKCGLEIVGVVKGGFLYMGGYLEEGFNFGSHSEERVTLWSGWVRAKEVGVGVGVLLCFCVASQQPCNSRGPWLYCASKICMINVLSSLTKNLLSNLITAKVHGCVAPPNFASSVLMAKMSSELDQLLQLQRLNLFCNNLAGTKTSLMPD
ncbi:hypothetical protein AAG906_002135 [Vitis piasezkii]